MNDFIDAYCERIGPEFWAEPINALTNLAFIVAGIAASIEAARAERRSRRDVAVWLLIALIFAIGIGSFLFHTFAVVWAAMADVIPIGLFILAYTYLALTRFARLAYWVGLIGVVVVIAMAFGLPGGPYGAALAAMAAIGLYLTFRQRHPAGAILLWAAGTFAVSLTLRTIDEPLCESLHMGTHFLWHLLNGVVLYLVTHAMIRYGRKIPSQGET
ncbi:MAG: ceramidase domain-containing protein [Pseudomonadota bacterium]